MDLNAFSSAELCEDLSLRRSIPDILRAQARYQLRFHLKQANEIFPSWNARQLSFVPPSGWMQMNPSVVNHRGNLLVALRCCNYIIDHRGPSQIEGTPFFSRTFLLAINPDTFEDSLISELTLAPDKDCFKPGVPSGFEDLRLISFDNTLWGSFTRCTQNPEGWPEMWLGRISIKHSNETHIDNLYRLSVPGKRKPEKNWMPLIDGAICFIYSCDPTIILLGDNKMFEEYPPIDASNFRGSSQAIAFGDDGWLAIVHSFINYKGFPKYSFRFVWFDNEYKLSAISPAFTLPANFESEIQNGYQYIMGLAWRPNQDKLIISYNLGDCQSWLASINASEVISQLKNIR